MKTDPVTLEILVNKYAAAAEQMGFALQRTGRTLYVKDAGDFGTGITTPQGRFFAYPWSIGVCGFVGGECGPALAAVQSIEPLEPGDVIITNHPYESAGLSSHLPDLNVVQPYFHDGEIVACGWSFVHTSDVGGRVPGSISPSNYEIYQEGLLIPPMKLLRRGEFNRDFLTLYRSNVRTPEPNVGDIKAMLAALKVGEQRIREVIDQIGAEAFVQSQHDVMTYAAGKALEILRKIPDGTYEFWDYLDDDYVTPFPSRIRVAMTVNDGHVHLDFSGSDPQTMSAFNLANTPNRHTWFPIRLIGFIVTYDETGTVPLNAGLFDSITVSAPKGTIVNAEPPAAVGVRHATGVRIQDVVNGALARAVPHMMTACNGSITVPIVLSEQDPRTGERKVQVIETLPTGQGAREGHDGVDGRDSNVSNMMNIPIESVEAAGGVIVRHYGLWPDSGGPGKWRGGTGMMLTFEVLGDGCMITARGIERLRFSAWGLVGGRPGWPGRVVLNMGTVAEKDLGKIDALPVQAGDTLTVMTPGSGGFGDPFERAPAAVLDDVRRRLVSVNRAEADYGVVIVDGRVDEPTTANHRTSGSGRESTTPFDFGPEREAWEKVFDDESMGVFVAKLLALPLAVRFETRRRILERVLPSLRDRSTSLREAIGDETATRARWLAALDALANGEWDSVERVAVRARYQARRPGGHPPRPRATFGEHPS